MGLILYSYQFSYYCRPCISWVCEKTSIIFFVLFPPSLSILSIVMLKSPSIILFSVPSHLFSRQFCIPSKKRPLTSYSLALCPTGAQTQRSLLSERVTLKETNLLFGSVSASVTPSRPEQAILLCEYFYE